MSPVDEDRYLRGMRGRRWTWERRAADPARSEQARVYATRRARALARPHVTKLDGCARQGVTVKCGCPGRRDVRWYTCRQHLTCERCRVQRTKRNAVRMREALEAAHAGAPRHKLVLLTLTLRHSGCIGTDRENLARGWRALYKALHRRRLVRRFAYVGVWEVTPGTDGLGHVHAHVAVFWPWIDWGYVREMWLKACPESERITMVANRKDGKKSSPKSVAKYLSKYIAKGTETCDFTPQLRADVLVATYQTRWIFTSRLFWLPFRPVCRNCGEPVIRAQYRWHAWNGLTDGAARDGPAGDPQAILQLPEPDKRPGCCGTGRV